MNSCLLYLNSDDCISETCVFNYVVESQLHGIIPYLKRYVCIIMTTRLFLLKHSKVELAICKNCEFYFHNYINIKKVLSLCFFHITVKGLTYMM